VHSNQNIHVKLVALSADGTEGFSPQGYNFEQNDTGRIEFVRMPLSEFQKGDFVREVPVHLGVSVDPNDPLWKFVEDQGGVMIRAETLSAARTFVSTGNRYLRAYHSHPHSPFDAQQFDPQLYVRRQDRDHWSLADLETARRKWLAALANGGAA